MFDPSTRILVVDDMLGMRKLITKICKELGFNDVTEAEDGAKAWEAVQNANPPFGLILSDWNMPKTSGLDFLKRLRTDSRFNKLIFVMISEETDQKKIMEVIKAGASNYVTKPFTSVQLKEKLEALYQKM